MIHLFNPIKFRSIELKNRIVVSPMCQYSCEDGFANDWHLVHLGSRAVGGAGLIIAEATAVSPEGRISPGDLGLWKDEHIAPLKRVTDFISKHGSVPGIQLAHAGRKASHAAPWKGSQLLSENEGGWKTVGPSPIAYSPKYDTPLELTKEGIEKVVNDFKAAAKRTLQAGFKIIEIHAAHGYLIHEFLSPLSNKRTDEYGGSFENRIRLLEQIVNVVRSEWPEEYPLFVRISASEWLDNGWTINDSVKLANSLKNKAVDLIDCSSAANVPRVQIPAGPGYQVPFAEQIKKESGIATGAVGFITDAKQAEEILAKGQADLIFMARELLRNPYFPLQAAFELGVEVEWPPQYERGKFT